MPEPVGETIPEATARFHKLVKTGSLADLQAALENDPPINAPGRLEETALMVAITVRDLDKFKLLLDHGADPELTDTFNSTALAVAVQADFPEAVQMLISLGVDRGYHPRYPLKKQDYGSLFVDVPQPMPEHLIGLLSEAEWQESRRSTADQMRELGENPTVEPVISKVQSVEVLKILLAAGEDLNLAPTEEKRALIGLETGGELRSTLNEYRQHKSPSYGRQNPQRMDFPFWQDMVRTGHDAYEARTHFGDTDISKPGAVWCFKRFGSTLVALPDGRYVQIGGEHEDFYDPDFFIYNDVVVYDGQGNFEIYGYPKNVFPPTDSHTATLVEDAIYLVGCFGYSAQRLEGFTPVYRLKLDTWQIEAVETRGEMPGWIHKHRTLYVLERNVLRVSGGELVKLDDAGEQTLSPNVDQFELNLATYRWTRTARPASR